MLDILPFYIMETVVIILKYFAQNLFLENVAWSLHVHKIYIFVKNVRNTVRCVVFVQWPQ